MLHFRISGASAFDDALLGNAEANKLAGGLGKDYSTGGGGADRSVYTKIEESAVGAERDRIQDFSHADGDRIDLSLIDAKLSTPTNDVFSFTGNSLFSGAAAGELRLSVGNILMGDVNGDGIADFHIQLQAGATVVQSDLIL